MIIDNIESIDTATDERFAHVTGGGVGGAYLRLLDTHPGATLLGTAMGILIPNFAAAAYWADRRAKK